MGHCSIRIKARRRKVASLAAYSRKYTVKNCTIPKQENVDRKDRGQWDIPKEGYPQPKSLRKAYKKKYYNHDGTIRKIVSHESDWKDFKDRSFRPKGRSWFMEQVVQHKIAKWERKNPCPVKQDKNPPDIFEQEYVVPWKAERERALEHFRDFVVSMYDKLPLTGRFKQSENKHVEEPIAEIKDVNMEGHKINDLDPDKSKLLKKAQKITNKVHGKNTNLVCTNLKDHKRKRGRIILPQAA